MGLLKKRDEKTGFTQLAIRMSDRHMEQIRQAAVEYNTTVSDIVRQALEIAGVIKKENE